MPSAVNDPNFEEALDHVILASEIQTKKKYPVLKTHLEEIQSHAKQHGLTTATLKRLLEVLTSPNALDHTTQKALFKILYPAGQVPSHLICMVVNALGYGSRKASVSNQQLLLKWMNVIHDVLEDNSILSSLYSVFFNLLDMDSLRADLCPLLAQITRRKHVRPFRVQMLQDLSQKVGREPALSKIMQIYDTYAPGMLDVKKATGRVPESSHPDPEWANQLQRILEKADHLSADPLHQREATPSFRRGPKRLRLSASVEGSYSLDRIDNAEDLVNNVEKVRITGLATSDLDDPVLQIYVTLGAEDSHTEDVNECLSKAFMQQHESLTSGRDAKKPLVEVLDEALAYTRYTKTLPKPVMTFLEKYLPEWLPPQHQGIILDLLSHIPLQTFSALQTTLLNPLETALLSAPTITNPLPTLLTFYTTLLTKWTAPLLSSPSAPTPSQVAILLGLAKHTNLLTQTLLTTSPTASTISLILTHLSSLPLLVAPPLSIPLPPPPPLTTYLIIFTAPSLSTLSRLCSLLTSWKVAFESNASTARDQGQIESLNAALMDTCNLLFRSRAFNAADGHALGCLIPPPVVTSLSTYTSGLDPPQPLTSLFSLSHNPNVSALSITAFREVEDSAEDKQPGSVAVRHAGPITTKSLAQLGREGGVKMGWKEYRVLVLRWLEGVGVSGIADFGAATMPGMKGGQDAVARAKAGVA